MASTHRRAGPAAGDEASSRARGCESRLAGTRPRACWSCLVATGARGRRCGLGLVLGARGDPAPVALRTSARAAPRPWPAAAPVIGHQMPSERSPEQPAGRPRSPRRHRAAGGGPRIPWRRKRRGLPSVLSTWVAGEQGPDFGVVKAVTAPVRSGSASSGGRRGLAVSALRRRPRGPRGGRRPAVGPRHGRLHPHKSSSRRRGHVSRGRATLALQRQPAQRSRPPGKGLDAVSA